MSRNNDKGNGGGGLTPFAEAVVSLLAWRGFPAYTSPNVDPHAMVENYGVGAADRGHPSMMQEPPVTQE